MFHKRLIKEFQDSKKSVAVMVILQWLMLLCNVVLIYQIAIYIESLVRQTTDEQNFFQASIKLIGVLCIVIIMRGVLQKKNSELAFLVSKEVKEQLRDKILTKLTCLGATYRNQLSTSEAVQITTEGVEQLEIYFSRYLPQFFYSLLAPLTLFILVGSMSMKAAIVLLLCVPLIPASIVVVQKFAKKMLAKYWGTYTGLGDSFLQCLQGLTTLKIYQADERYAKKMDEEAEQFRKVTMRVLIMQLNSISVMDLVAYGGAALGIIIGLREFQSGNIGLAQCFFLIMISAEFFLPLRLLGSFFHIAMNGNAAADKIFALMDTEEKEGQKGVGDGTWIKFEDVNFAYEENHNILQHVNIEVKRGITAFAGESGCGKSTMVSLLMGEITPTNGHVTLNGIDIHDINRKQRYQKITRIRHDSYLFAGTVEDNLKMGNEKASEEEMWHAIRKVQLEKFLLSQQGLNTQLLEKASNLSGGQKQRLALARAILHDSDLYIFDEATSNIDVESENAIMEVVRELGKEKAIILISHRLANLSIANQIYVLQEAEIKESGTHDSLMKQGQIYKELYLKQKELEDIGRMERCNEAV